jgi:hypothetical protein
MKSHWVLRVGIVAKPLACDLRYCLVVDQENQVSGGSNSFIECERLFWLGPKDSLCKAKGREDPDFRIMGLGKLSA